MRYVGVQYFQTWMMHLYVSTIIDLMEYQVIQEMGTKICTQGEFAFDYNGFV